MGIPAIGIFNTLKLVVVHGFNEPLNFQIIIIFLLNRFFPEFSLNFKTLR